MGPEDNFSLPNSLQLSDEIPPSFDGYGDYQQYGENIILWDAMTSISATRRAPTIIGQLTGQAKVTRKTLPLAYLTAESGVISLLPEIYKKFGLDTVTLLHNNISDFFDYSWDETMSVDEFVVGFHSRLENVRKMDMNDELKGYHILKQANLDGHDRNLVVGGAGGDYPLQPLGTSLKNAFRTECLTAVSMNTNRPRYRHSSPAMASLRKSRGIGSQIARFGANPSFSNSPLLYTNMSLDKESNVTRGIIDSGPCCSVVGRETLDSAVHELGIDELKDENICQQEHLLGPLEQTHENLLCSSRAIQMQYIEQRRMRNIQRSI